MYKTKQFLYIIKQTKEKKQKTKRYRTTLFTKIDKKKPSIILLRNKKKDETRFFLDGIKLERGSYIT